MRRRGFTLIELLLVIAIVATLAALVAPSFAGALARGRVDSTARTVVALAQAARARASAEGRAYILVIDGDEKSVKLERARDPLVAQDAPQTMVGATAPPDVESSDWNDAAQWAGPFAFEDGVTLGTFDVTDGMIAPPTTGTPPPPTPVQTDAPKAARITFAPDGTCDAATIELVGPAGDHRVVKVHGPSGRARIEEEAPPQ